MKNNPIKLRGVNLGGWLLMEGYILHGRNIAESMFKDRFLAKHGYSALRAFERLFRDTFIAKQDFARIASLHATVIRLPFNYRLVDPAVDADHGLRYVRFALDQAQAQGLKVILDLHAAPGAQNADWHSDSQGAALLWQRADYREHTIRIWERLVAEVKDHPAVHGYDVLNEPVVARGSLPRLTSLYRSLVSRIKAIDAQHTIYLEGNRWAQEIDFLEDILDDGVAISIHTYHPLQYVFNFVPFMSYPGTIEAVRWDRRRMRSSLKPYADFSRKHNVEVFVGEFGIHWRGGAFGERQWLDDIMTTYDDYGFGYTYWTYKAVANSHFPDGIYQFVPNSPYVRREGPVFGWENYIDGWMKDRTRIAQMWDTGCYTPNRDIIAVLKRHFAG